GGMTASGPTRVTATGRTAGGGPSAATTTDTLPIAEQEMKEGEKQESVDESGEGRPAAAAEPVDGPGQSGPAAPTGPADGADDAVPEPATTAEDTSAGERPTEVRE